MRERLRLVVERPSPARPLAWFRIMVGFAALLKAFDLAGRLWRLTQPPTVEIPWFTWMPDLGEAEVVVLLVVWVFASVAFIVGWRPLIAGLILAATLVLALLSDQQLYSNHLYLLIVLVGLTAVSNAGSAWSIDARRHGGSDWVPASWSITLIRIQISVVYAFAALSKLNGPFLSGTIVGSTLGRGLVPVPPPMLDAPIVEIVSVSVILIELSIAVLLWIPRRRALAIGLGVVLHASITLTMSPTIQLAAFSLMMLGSYALFLDARPSSLVAVWDDRCSFCSQAKAILQRVDGFGVVDWLGSWRDQPSVSAMGVDADAATRAMQLIGPDGYRSSGYRAITEILARGPGTYLVAPMLMLPLVRSTGERVYRRLAQRRSCEMDVAPVGVPPD